MKRGENSLALGHFLQLFYIHWQKQKRCWWCLFIFWGRAISNLFVRQSSLNEASLILWTFFLDETHYARWLSVHVADLLSLEEKNHKLHEKTTKRFITTCKKYSHWPSSWTEEQTCINRRRCYHDFRKQIFWNRQ